MQVPPEEMTPPELEALIEARRRPLPKDIAMWWESVRRIRDRDLRRILK